MRWLISSVTKSIESNSINKRIHQNWGSRIKRPVFPSLLLDVDLGGDSQTINEKLCRQRLEWLTPYNMRII